MNTLYLVNVQIICIKNIFLTIIVYKELLCISWNHVWKQMTITKWKLITWNHLIMSKLSLYRNTWNHINVRIIYIR